MTNAQIKKELEKIYKIRKGWNGAKGPFDRLSVRRRELILLKQYLLYRIEDAKMFGDKNEESFNLTTYNAMSEYLKCLKNKKI